METPDRPENYDGTYSIPSLEGVHGRLELRGPVAKRYVIIDDGKLTVTPQNGGADTVITVYEPGDLVRLVRGELNIVTSLLQGRVSVEGDPMLAVEIAGSMPDIGRRPGQFTQKGDA